MNDKQLRQDVIDELEFESSIDAADIGVLVEDGVVTLNGHVPIYAHKLAAERAAWRVRGVKAIVQDIEVRLAGDRSNNEQVAKRALDILHWDGTVPEQVHVTVDDGWLRLSGQVDWQYQRDNAEIQAGQIQVEINDGGTVTVDGKVDDWVEKRAVARAIWSIPGVRALQDNLVIS